MIDPRTASTPQIGSRASSIPKDDPRTPSTPQNISRKALPKTPIATPRLKKKVPWRGKNIMVLLPRDEERGLPGNAPKPLCQDEIEKMFDSWKELGYNIEGFDLLVEGQAPGTDDSQSREDWPLFDDVEEERSAQTYKVMLPDLNGTFNFFVAVDHLNPLDHADS
jgi:hypothetical protein